MLLEVSLTDIGFDLASLDPARPREVALRRAVSSAYYATFHALCRLCADELVGVVAPPEDRVAMYRAVEHIAFRRVLRQALTTGRPSRRVSDILTQVIQLQEQRHLADYDPRPQKFGGRSAVRALVSSAEATVADIQALTATDKKALAVALITGRRSR